MKTYQELWADEDGMLLDGQDRLPINQPRGTAEQVNDDSMSTDHISTGPLASRLLSLLKFEHRSDANSNENTNGEANLFSNDADEMNLDGPLPNGDTGDRPLPPAASISDLTGSKMSSQRLDYVQSDERIKAELRHLGLLQQDDNP